MSVLGAVAPPRLKWIRRPVGAGWVSRLVVAIVVELALQAVVLGGAAIRSLAGQAPSAPPAGVGQTVPITFGDLVAQTALTLPDGAPGALAADGRGAVDPPPGEVWFDVSAEITNTTSVPRPFGADRFRLRLGRDGVALAPARTSPDEVVLAPVSGDERLLGFLVPASHPAMWLEFDDPGSGRRVLIDLSRVGQLPNHHGTGPDHVH